MQLLFLLIYWKHTLYGNIFLNSHTAPFGKQLCIIWHTVGFDFHSILVESCGVSFWEWLLFHTGPEACQSSWQTCPFIVEKKKYQIGSPDKSWQTNQKHTEIRLFNLRTVSHSDWQALQVTPCQPAKGMSASDHNSWERKSNWFSLLMFLMTHFQLKV